MENGTLESNFTKEFLDDFIINDPEFYSLFKYMQNGMTPYQVIEHLCKSKRVLFKELERQILNNPQKIIVTSEELENLIRRPK